MAVLNLILKATDGGAEAALSSLDQKVATLDKSFVQKIDNIGGSMQRLGGALTLGVTTPLIGVGLALTNMASDLGETTSKVGELFGASADEVMAWSKTTADSIGQSQQAALDGAATFAIFGKAAGLSGQELVSFSTDFVELASDLASFNNTSPEEAILAIGAALRGESEPLRKYGVLLDDASMRNKALQLGIISTTKEALTPQQKVLAAQALIYEQTSAAQGDFARTSDGLANQQRILKARLVDTGTELGTKLLPLALQLVEKVSALVNWFSNLSDGTQGWIVKIGMLAAAAGPVITVLGTFAKGLALIGSLISGGGAIAGGLTTVIGALGTAIAVLVNPITLVVGAIGLLAAAFIGDWGGIRTATVEGAKAVWEGIKGLGESLGEWWKGIRKWFADIDWGELGRGILDGIIDVFVKAPLQMYEALKKMFTGAFDKIKSWLGIASPSKVAAREIGLPIAQGVGVGIQAGMPAAMRQVTNNNYFSIALTGSGYAGQDITSSVQMLATLYG